MQLKIRKNGKAPGPDGLPAEFYKTFEEVFLLPYKNLLKEIEEKGLSWSEAIISLTHKENRDRKM